MTRDDYQKYDYLIGMDSYNKRNMMRILEDDPEGEACCLLDFTGVSRDIADPWYTGDFKQTYEDIRRGCQALLERL